MVLFMPLPWINYSEMIFLYYNWAYWLSVVSFGLLIYPSFATTIDSTYDMITRYVFQCSMSIQLTSVAYYFSIVYIAQSVSSQGPTDDVLVDIYDDLAPVGLIMVPCACFLIDFFIDKIYFTSDTWYLCFVPVATSVLNVTLSYLR